MTHNPFRNRVQQFWNAFVEEEAIIRQMIDDNAEGSALITFAKSILNIAFTEVQFQIGINIDNKYELILTPQGDRIKLIQYYYWSQYIPESLADRWVFHASMPALKDTNYKVEMFGVVLDENDLTLYPTINHFDSKIELEVYCPKLDGKSDSQRYSIFFVLLDQHISEQYSIEHINNIQFVDKKENVKGISITQLKNHIDSTIDKNGWANSRNPLDGYIAYNVQQSSDPNWILREDIYAGYSSCTAPISAYHFKDASFVEKYLQDGIVFGFLFYENSGTSNEHLVPLRATIEDMLIEQCMRQGIATCIGGATGFHFSYIDLIIYDYYAFLKIAKSIFSRYSFEEAGFSYFQSESRPIMISEIE